MYFPTRDIPLTENQNLFITLVARLLSRRYSLVSAAATVPASSSGELTIISPANFLF